MSPVMLDSGAYSVWTKGEKIDLGEYIEFCQQNPNVTYYVNLDVIPGKHKDRSSITPTSVEAAASQSWKNYQRMLKSLPVEKVVPVYHQNDHVKWLQKYIDFGTPLLGISPADDRSTKERREWLDRTFDLICSTPDRMPKIRTHGFGITSYRIMTRFPFWSIDSATWAKRGGYGEIIVPRMRAGKFIFSEPPWTIAVSMENKTRRSIRSRHYLSMSKGEQRVIRTWLKEIGIPLGKEKNGAAVKDGVITNPYLRWQACIRFFEAMRQSIPEYPWPFYYARKRRGFNLF